MPGPYAGHSDDAYPDVFNLPAMPPQPKKKKPGQLSEGEIKRFFEEGYVVVKDFFSPSELEPCRKALEKLVDDVAHRLYNAGKISSLYNDCDLFHERLQKMDKEWPGAAILVIKTQVLPQAMKDIWTNERLLNVVEQLIGPNIAGNCVFNMRSKLPQHEPTVVPWHQDNAYFDHDAYKQLIPTAWIPFVDANEKNGCLQFLRRGQKSGRTADHTCCWQGTWYVMLEEEEMTKSLGVNMEKDLRLVEVPYGGMVLFSNAIPHQSLPNVSNEIRWSMDLRWQDANKPSAFHGLKEAVVFRTEKDPNYVIDWESFDAVDRTDVQLKAVEDIREDKPEEGFDTLISGPWMKMWEVTNTNRHVVI
ncbi:uncharacterized protein LOC134258774 [Saccostrea cucullata]|uniref:uncharacterized protein LOC134258774 n=1 Tax=Saccostrea cuccullata TaxID=36930 RepID=UPI002ED11074